jgi:hypothetical protein
MIGELGRRGALDQQDSHNYHDNHRLIQETAQRWNHLIFSTDACSRCDAFYKSRLRPGQWRGGEKSAGGKDGRHPLDFCTPSPSRCFIFGEQGQDARPLANRRPARKAKLTTALAALGWSRCERGLV